MFECEGEMVMGWKDEPRPPVGEPLPLEPFDVNDMADEKLWGLMLPPEPPAACFCDLAQRRPHALQSVLLPFGPERHLRDEQRQLDILRVRGK